MRTSDLALERDSLFEVPGFRKSEPEARAFRFVTYEDLDSKWKDEESYFLFVIFAKDSLTSFGKVFSREYYLKRESLKEGTFRKGSLMDIRYQRTKMCVRKHLLSDHAP